MHWTPTDFDPPFASFERTAFAAGTIYNVGTAPGVAASEPNPLLVTLSTDDGATWQQVEMPVDTHAGSVIGRLFGERPWRYE